MAFKRINISLNPSIVDLGERIKKARRFSGTGLSRLIEALIREEWERKNGPMALTEQPDGHIASDSHAKRKRNAPNTDAPAKPQ